MEAAAAIEQAPSRDYAAIAAALGTVAVWASAFVGIRSAGRSFSPGALSLGRLTVALVALAAVALVRRERLPSRDALREVGLPLLVCGLLWFGVYNVVLNSGERRVDAGTAAMLVNVGPILIAVLAGLFLHEGFPRSLFSGVAVAFAGVAVIAIASSDAHGDDERRPPLPRRRSRVRGRRRHAEGRPTPADTVPDRLRLRGRSAWSCASRSRRSSCASSAAGHGGATGWIVYLGIAPTALGFLMWSFALSRTNAGRLAATTYLVPPISCCSVGSGSPRRRRRSPTSAAPCASPAWSCPADGRY